MFDQQVEVIPCKTLPNVPTRHGALDVVIIRENMEGEYSGLEQEIVPGVVQSLKITTDRQSEHTARFAFEFAKTNGRKKITAIHKANIMKVCIRKSVTPCSATNCNAS
jgi:isocitrate dehydrogenase (NAD+)